MGALPGRDTLLADTVYVLKFSRVFFDAFRISNDRVNQWMFLAFLLGNPADETGVSVKIRDLLKDNREFEAFLKSSKLETEEYAFKQLLDGFGNEHGPFLDLSAKRRHDRALLFNQNFKKAAIKYLDGFYSGMAPGLSPTFEREDLAVVVDHLRSIILFQRDYYLPAWKKFVGALASAAQHPNALKSEIEDRLPKFDPAWCLLLTAWRKHLGDPDIVGDRAGLFSAVFEQMRGVVPDEIDECIEFLCQKDGPRILSKTGTKHRATYELDPKFVAHFEAYIKQVAELRQKMLQMLAEVRKRKPVTSVQNKMSAV